MNPEVDRVASRSLLFSLPALFFISFLSLFNTFVRTVFSPFTPIICQDFSLSHTDIGNLFFILSAGFSFTLFGSQFISTKISHKGMILLSLVSTSVSLILTGFSTSFLELRLGMFAIGLSSGFFMPSAITLLRQSVDPLHLGKAFGIFGTAQSIAFILGSFIVESWASQMSWQTTLIFLGIFGFGITLLSSLFLQAEERKETPALTLSFAATLFQSPSFWIILTLLCLANGLNIGIYNMAPDYFSCHNLLESSEVNRLMEIARILSIGTAILAGVLADRFGLRRAIAFAFISCGMATLLMGTLSPSLSLAFFCLQSPLAACLKPLVHFAMATIVSPEKNSSLVSMMAPFAFLTGSGLLPQLLGFLGDSHFYAQGFIGFGMMTILIGVWFYSSKVYKHVHISQTEGI